MAIPTDNELFYSQQNIIFGGSMNLLRGFMINDEYAAYQQAELAGPQAEVKVAQKRQDLYLAGQCNTGIGRWPSSKPMW